MAKYCIYYNNQEVGPMDLSQLKHYGLTPNSMIRVDGGPWVQAFTVPEVMSVVNQPAPPSMAGYESKDHIVAGLLAIIIGSLGIQYFYIGKTKAGIYTILLTLVTCGLWSVITFIQGICMLMQTQAEFDNKYVNTPSSFPIF